MSGTEKRLRGSEATFASEFVAGARDIIPLVVGAIPFGIIFGTLSGESGLSFGGTLAMSVFVFAGSAQFIALGLMAAGTGWAMIVLTTFVVNLRHLLYGATMLPYYRRLPKSWQMLLSFWLTDEAFAVAIRRYQDGDDSELKHVYNLGSAFFMYASWVFATFVGLTAGRAFPEISRWGLDFAMLATFIGMVIPYLVTKPMWASVTTAGAVSLMTASFPHKLGLITAAVAGVAAGIMCEMIDERGEQCETGLGEID